jgi:tRNA pseudouridine38/39 synthase
MTGGYERWTHEQLVARIQELELQLHPPERVSTTNIAEPNPTTFTSALVPSSAGEPKQIPYRKPSKQSAKAFDASKYSTRLIALKFAYLGQKYNGFEHHNNNTTPLPTIEEELWKALAKTRLINPTPNHEGTERYDRIDKKSFQAWDKKGADVNWESCEYSKCGRTDRGVSAFGQVIGVRVRSNRPLPKTKPSSVENMGAQASEGQEEASALADSEKEESTKPFDELQDELPYIQLLNRVLPPDIRIYAWCPNPPPNFSARFSCKERRYKYFFTNPCFGPVPGSSGLYSSATNQVTMREGWLDIDSMRQACKELVGLHDFRNFCKIDASKQLTNFNRRIFHADIEEISPLSFPSYLAHPAARNPAATEEPKMYAFVLHGSAFLWHQVRSIVAILFLIGQGLESPSLIPQLLDISKNPTRPKYEMASDAPLVLWDCIFPHDSEVQTSEEREHGYEDRLEWVYVGDDGGIEPKSLGKAKNGGPSTMGRGKWGRGGVIDDVWEMWRGNKVDETLSALLLDTIAAQGQSTLDAEKSAANGVGTAKVSPRVFDGSNLGRAKGKYTLVMRREKNDPVELVNERYAKRKGLDLKKIEPNADEADE